MTFAWHFCFQACFCFPCSLESLPVSSVVIQIQPILQSSSQILSWWILSMWIFPVSQPCCPFVRVIQCGTSKLSIYKSLVLNYFIYMKFCFPWKLSFSLCLLIWGMLIPYNIRKQVKGKSRIIPLDMIRPKRAYMLKEMLLALAKWRNITGTRRE